MIQILMIMLGLLANQVGHAQPRLAVSPLVIASVGHVYRFRVELADTEASRDTGMMFRHKMGRWDGMLFDYREARNGVVFWMKDTLIPLDMIFITPDGTIARIEKMAMPLSQTPIPAGATIRAVLEVKGGTAARLRLKPGDKIRHRIFGNLK